MFILVCVRVHICIFCVSVYTSIILYLSMIFSFNFTIFSFIKLKNEQFKQSKVEGLEFNFFDENDNSFVQSLHFKFVLHVIAQNYLADFDETLQKWPPSKLSCLRW